MRREIALLCNSSIKLMSGLWPTWVNSWTAHILLLL